MVLVCMERNEVERNTTVCGGRLTIIAIMLFAVAGRGIDVWSFRMVESENSVYTESVHGLQIRYR